MKKIISCLIIGILLVSIVLGEYHFNELSGQDLAAEIEQGNVDLSQLEPAKLNEALNLNPSLWWIRPDVEDAVDEKLSSEPSFLTGENIDRWFYVKGKFLGVTGTTIVNYNKEIGEVTLSNTNLKISNLDSGLYQRARIENGKIIFPDQTEVSGDATVSAEGETLNVRGGTLTVTQMNVEGVTQMNVKGTYTVTGGIAEIDGVEYTADGPMRVEPGVIGPVLSSLTIETIDASGGLQDEPSKITGMRDGLVVDKFIGSVEFGNRYKIIKPGTIYNPHTADGQSLATIQPVEILNYVSTGGNRGVCLNACILEEGLELHARANTEAIITVLETDKMNYFQSDPLISGRIVLRSINFGVFTLTGSRHELEPGYTISGEFPNINIDVAYFNDEGFQKFFYDAPNNDISISYPALDPALLPPTPPGLEVVGKTFVAQAAEPQAQKYTVKPGDTLLKIARDFRERGYDVTDKQIIEANKDKYSSLVPYPDDIKIGWTFDIPIATLDSTIEAAKTGFEGRVDFTNAKYADGTTPGSINGRSGPGLNFPIRDSLELTSYETSGFFMNEEFMNEEGEAWAYLKDQNVWVYVEDRWREGDYSCTGPSCPADFDQNINPNLVTLERDLIPPTKGEKQDLLVPLIYDAAQNPPITLVRLPEPNPIDFQMPLPENSFEISGKMTRKHNGIDYAAVQGTPIYSAAEGRVIETDCAWPNGCYVKIQHPNGISTAYLHMQKVDTKSGTSVQNGQNVERGQQIGTVGNTGRVRGIAGGYHLHYVCYKDEVPVDPDTYCSS